MQITKTKIIVAIIVVFVLFFIKANIGYNSATQILVKQSPFGNMSCVDHAGFYFKGFSTIYNYDRTKDFYFNSSTEREWEGDDTDEDDINVTLSRNANADISGYVKYQLPVDCESMIKLHMDQRSDKGVKHGLIRNSVLSAVRKTAPIFTAEEAKVTKIAEFRRIAEDQLIYGEYLTKTEKREEKVGEDEIVDGKIVKKAEVQEYTVTTLAKDSLGQRIIIKESALQRYNIRVIQFEIQNVKLDKKAQEQLDIVKTREMERIANATASETAKQQALTAVEKGKARVAEEKAEQEVVKIREVTQAEKERDVAILNAQREKEVARLAAEKAIEDAKRIKAEGEAEAAANRAKVAAGLSPQEKLEGEIKMEEVKWEAIAKMTVPIVPNNAVYINGSNGKSISGVDMLGIAKSLEVLQNK